MRTCQRRKPTRGDRRGRGWRKRAGWGVTATATNYGVVWTCGYARRRTGCRQVRPRSQTPSLPTPCACASSLCCFSVSVLRVIQVLRGDKGEKKEDRLISPFACLRNRIPLEFEFESHSRRMISHYSTPIFTQSYEKPHTALHRNP